MIIKRWSGSAFVEEYPKTTTANIFTSNGVTQIFSANKILPAYLPDSVFDTLKFNSAISAAASNGTIADAILGARDTAVASGNVQAVKGAYFVISANGTINNLIAAQGAVNYIGTYATLRFKPQDGGSSATLFDNSGPLEVGDWFVIEGITGGDGTSGSPYVFVASVINNSFEVMGAASAGTAGTPGIVPASSAGDQLKFLRADATWVVPTNTTYTGSTSITLNGTSFERAALTGDVTAAGNSNATTIANNAVTFGKFQQVATSRIVGRITASTGNVEELTAANVRTIIELAAPIYIQNNTVVPTATVTNALWYDIT